jgi:hypothetical protein
MIDLRIFWNGGSALCSIGLPLSLIWYELSLRGILGQHIDLKFIPPALASAGLGLLFPCFLIGRKPQPGTTPEAVQEVEDYNWSAVVLLLATAWFVVGGVLWWVALGYSIKGTYPALWPAWSFRSFNPDFGVAGSQTLVYYCVAMILAVVKLAKS